MTAGSRRRSASSSARLLSSVSSSARTWSSTVLRWSGCARGHDRPQPRRRTAKEIWTYSPRGSCRSAPSLHRLCARPLWGRRSTRSRHRRRQRCARNPDGFQSRASVLRRNSRAGWLMVFCAARRRSAGRSASPRERFAAGRRPASRPRSPRIHARSRTDAARKRGNRALRRTQRERVSQTNSERFGSQREK